MKKQICKLVIVFIMESICLLNVVNSDDTKKTINKKTHNALEELKVKRENVFNFVTKPSLKQDGDKTEISFETEGFCDVTIVIENAEGKIVRHLASGVLGNNAPLPFQKNTKKQTVIWDGKNDQEAYIDNKQDHTVRVSLGLKPQFERNVLWSPYRRANPSIAPILTACEEGMLIFNGQGVDHLRLFDHDGNYLRTIYPFSKKKLNEVRGLDMHTFPQSGQKLPLKLGHVQATLLTSGSSSNETDIFGNGYAATAIASRGKEIVLAGVKNINWLALDGSTGGKNLTGPSTKMTVALNGIHEFRGGNYDVGPRSMAYSPDGKWIYLTCYFWSFPWHQGVIHGVLRMPADGSEPPTLWKGSIEQSKYHHHNRTGGVGEAPADFLQPMSVACDAQGRVYVADYFNDRIQVFNADGSFVRSIPSNKPTKVTIDPKTGDIYVFSWAVSNVHDWHISLKKNPASADFPATLTHFGSITKPDKKVTYSLPTWWVRGSSIMHHDEDKGKQGGFHTPAGWWITGEIDFKAKEPTVWLIPAAPWQNKYDLASVKLYTLKDGKMELKRDTGIELKNKIPMMKPAPFARTRLYTNPKNGILYVADQINGVDKNFNQVTEYNPTTGVAKLVDLPCVIEDMAIDLDGLAYLRVDQGIIRYDTETWKEVLWDYGQETEGVMFSGTSGGKSVTSDSVLRVPGVRTNPFWHLGGISVTTKGHIAVTSFNSYKLGQDLQPGKRSFETNNRSSLVYKPNLYPGRLLWGEIHIYDKYGQVITNDALPGLGHSDGIAVGKDNSIYAMMASTRLLDGKKYDSTPTDYTGTIVKVPMNEGRVINKGTSQTPIPLEKSQYPERQPDVSSGKGSGGEAWIENAEWFYGGVGSVFMNKPAPSCLCWNSRFTLDLLDRSFAPELRHSSVAVLDTAGNLILRIGSYGNVDDGKPLIPEPEMKAPTSIGGDEVALFYAPYVTTHTDKRVYIADPGNNRVVSVLLNYHTNERLSMKNK